MKRNGAAQPEQARQRQRDAEGRSDAAVESACFGVAGPVLGETAELTNTPWRVDAPAAARVLKLPSSRVRLLNDLEAMAYGVPVLHDSEVHVLQPGPARSVNNAAAGNIAVIAAGTGLGEAFLHRVGGRFVALASEAGHADFAARTDRDINLLKHLVARYGRAQVEHVISGPGLVNIHSHPSSEPLNKGWNDEVGSRKLYNSSLYEIMPIFRPDAASASRNTVYCVRASSPSALHQSILT